MGNHSHWPCRPSAPTRDARAKGWARMQAEGALEVQAAWVRMGTSIGARRTGETSEMVVSKKYSEDETKTALG